jgi:predicted nucleic acid-binding protein
MDLITDLGSGPVGVDTAVFIYFIEEEIPLLGPVEALFKEASAGRLQLVTSALTLLEVLVVPYRARDNSLAERYEALLTRSRGLHMLDLSPELLRAAAQLRAVTGIKTPDALQIAAALSAGCKAFVTNDRRIPAISGLRILQISDYVG